MPGSTHAARSRNAVAISVGVNVQSHVWFKLRTIQMSRPGRKGNIRGYGSSALGP